MTEKELLDPSDLLLEWSSLLYRVQGIKDKDKEKIKALNGFVYRMMRQLF